VTLRLKHGLSEVTRMQVSWASTVSAALKNAAVEGDWVKISAVGAVTGMPSSAGGLDITVEPVAATAGNGVKNSFAICINPQQPDCTVPGGGITVACGHYIGYTDRYNTALTNADYAGKFLEAVRLTIAGSYVYCLSPISDETSLALMKGAVAVGLGVVNGELIFRYLP
jgi:hypothetical protein